VTIPFLVSSRGYGFLWNSPAIGRVELGNTGTRWVADSARQIDYWVTAGAPADVLCHYADATGKAPTLSLLGKRVLAVKAPLQDPRRAHVRGS
jgi:alpha-D-xyloside xylohydrolase